MAFWFDAGICGLMNTHQQIACQNCVQKNVLIAYKKHAFGAGLFAKQFFWCDDLAKSVHIDFGFIGVQAKEVRANWAPSSQAIALGPRPTSLGVTVVVYVGSFLKAI